MKEGKLNEYRVWDVKKSGKIEKWEIRKGGQKVFAIGSEKFFDGYSKNDPDD